MVTKGGLVTCVTITRRYCGHEHRESNEVERNMLKIQIALLTDQICPNSLQVPIVYVAAPAAHLGKPTCPLKEHCESKVSKRKLGIRLLQLI